MVWRGAAAHHGQQSQLPSGPVRSPRRPCRDGRSCTPSSQNSRRSSSRSGNHTTRGQDLSQSRGGSQMGESRCPSRSQNCRKNPRLRHGGRRNHGCG